MKYVVDEDHKENIRQSFVDLSNALLEGLDSECKVRSILAYNQIDMILDSIDNFISWNRMAMNSSLILSQFELGRDIGWTPETASHPLLDKEETEKTKTKSKEYIK